VSADDHVVEHPRVWTDRLPRKYQEVGPRVVSQRVGEMVIWAGGKTVSSIGVEGEYGDCWVYEDKVTPMTRLSSSVGYPREEVKALPTTFTEMRAGCYDQAARLADMDVNWVDASLCFPTYPRFCGQTFLEAKDRELALLCVRAYNDWMVEEWCSGSS